MFLLIAKICYYYTSFRGILQGFQSNSKNPMFFKKTIDISVFLCYNKLAKQTQ